MAGHRQPLDPARLKLHEEERQRTNQHYDLDPRVFSLFLDSSLKYSSGLYLTEDDTLDQAQIQKMSFIADQLGLKGGEKTLDIGCGWGSLVCFLAERYGCTVVGVTPSPKQASYIQERARRLGLSDRVQIQVTHIQETAFSAGSFDAISLVGSIVHMKDKRGVIAECHRLCRRRGRVYLSETCFRNWERHREFSERPGTRFVCDTIFGWAESMPLSAFIEQFEQVDFSLCGLTDLTPHYLRTLDAWQQNITRHRDELESLQPGLAESFLKYFEIASVGFHYTAKQYAVVASKQR